jgi:hypothetical protein
MFCYLAPAIKIPDSSNRTFHEMITKAEPNKIHRINLDGVAARRLRKRRREGR